jgi:hypothetical protein
MRTLLLLTAGAALSAIPVAAQVPEPRGTDLPTYRFGPSVPIVECDFDGVEGSTRELAPPGSEFFVVNEVPRPAVAGQTASSVIVLQFLSWKPGSPKHARFNVNAADALSPTLTWCAHRSVFNRFATRIYETGFRSWDLAAGVLLLPIKMRLGGDGRNFDFSRDVTLGTVVGPRIRLTPRREVHLSGLVGAGVTAVTLNSENTAGALTGATDRAAVTLTGGLMLEVQRFQVGIMYGVDRISQPNQTDWAYQGKPWLSIGLGYTLLSAAPQSPASGQQ